ncbi:MAG: D-glycero-beta-D-manno-heptose-7-phosphate kinase [Candidatus Omnitrophica bacterium]|nr:D-glycero-beta-D-manno-heptose-7-phosphate kinase [Candidatus Omnitrophota bacterium]
MKKISAEKILSIEDTKGFLEKVKKLNVLVVGDLILDKFIWGSVRRISPEAPVPIVEVRKETVLAGGAGNVCLNIVDLGADVSLCGKIGDDINGQIFVDILNKRNINHSLITENNYATITKTRIIAGSQQLVRIDHEQIKNLISSELEKIKPFFKEAIRRSNAVLISDYGKGMITPSLIQFISREAKGRILTVDPKINHFSYYKKVTCLTPNQYEASAGIRLPEPQNQESINRLGIKIRQKLKCRNLIITQGKDGMTIFTETGEIYQLPAISKEVYDVTGAGDTVISVLTLALANGFDILKAGLISNFSAAIVVQKIGTATIMPVELENIVRENIREISITKY